jgi:hypothetical protein
MSEVAVCEVDEIDIEGLKRQNEELAQTLLEVRQDVRSRVLLSELKVEAVRAGIIDVDCIKILDLDQINAEEQNITKIVAQLIRDFKLEKPWLFQSTSSSTMVALPSAEASAQRRVMEMTDAEYRSARAEMLRQMSL